MRRIKITYDITTPESAADGEFSETGWIDEEGREITPDSYDLDEYETETAAVIALAVKEIGNCVEPSNSPTWHPHTWYTDSDPDRDYSTGAETRQSYHLEGFTEEEERAIYSELKKR